MISGEQLILQHRVDDEECIDALDTETSLRLWRFSRPTSYKCEYPYTHGPYATPTIGPGAVYAVTAEGEILAIERETGELIWSRQLLAEFDAPEGAFGFGNSPRLCGELLILNVGGRPEAGIVALDAETGETRWAATNHNRSHTTAVPAIQHGQPRLYVLTEAALVSLELATGQVLWEIPFGVRDTPERVNAVTPVVVENRVIMCSGPGPGMVILDIQPDGSCVEVARQRRVLDPQYTNLLPLGNCIYGVTSRASAIVRCADLNTGEQLWEFVSDLCRANSLYADGHLVFLGEHGHLAVLRPSRTAPDVAWISDQPVLQGPCYSAPALSRGRLYLRNEQEVVCLDLRGTRESRSPPISVIGD